MNVRLHAVHAAAGVHETTNLHQDTHSAKDPRWLLVHTQINPHRHILGDNGCLRLRADGNYPTSLQEGKTPRSSLEAVDTVMNSCSWRQKQRTHRQPVRKNRSRSALATPPESGLSRIPPSRTACQRRVVILEHQKRVNRCTVGRTAGKAWQRQPGKRSLNGAEKLTEIAT